MRDGFTIINLGRCDPILWKPPNPITKNLSSHSSGSNALVTSTRAKLGSAFSFCTSFYLVLAQWVRYGISSGYLTYLFSALLVNTELLKKIVSVPNIIGPNRLIMLWQRRPGLCLFLADGWLLFGLRVVFPIRFLSVLMSSQILSSHNI